MPPTAWKNVCTTRSTSNDRRFSEAADTQRHSRCSEKRPAGMSERTGGRFALVGVYWRALQARNLACKAGVTTRSLGFCILVTSSATVTTYRGVGQWCPGAS